MKELTTTKAMYRDTKIAVLSDRFDGNRLFCCTNSLGGRPKQEKWFRTQAEAIAHEKQEIDKRLGFEPVIEERSFRKGR